MLDTEYAWAAGIVDGEGTITLMNNGKFNITPRVLMAMTHEPTILEMKRIFPDASTRKDFFKNSPNHKYRYWFQAGGQKCISIVKTILPYLVTKKEQAKLVIEYGEKCMFGRGPNNLLNEDQKELRANFLNQIRDLNRKGPK